MEKNLIKQIVAGEVVLVEGAKKLTALVINDVFEIIDDDGDTHNKVVKRDLSRDELSLVLGDTAAILREANVALNEQNTILQTRAAALEGLVAKAATALARVAQADADWDSTPRAQVVAALQAIEGQG